MAEFLQVTAVWQGFTGAPGYNIFSFVRTAASLQADMDNSCAALRVFYDAIKGHITNSVSITIDPTATLLRAEDGQLLGAATATTPPAAVAGTHAGAMALPAGAVVSWLTGTIRGRRVLRGRTFIVPLTVAAYEPNGTLISTSQGAISNAANIMCGTSSIGVWGRPTRGAADGVVAEASSATVPDKVAVLRSRRD